MAAGDSLSITWPVVGDTGWGATLLTGLNQLEASLEALVPVGNLNFNGPMAMSQQRLTDAYAIQGADAG